MDRSRELRLWLKQIIIPGAFALILVDRQYPNLKYQVRDKVKEFADKTIHLMDRKDDQKED